MPQDSLTHIQLGIPDSTLPESALTLGSEGSPPGSSSGLKARTRVSGQTGATSSGNCVERIGKFYGSSDGEPRRALRTHLAHCSQPIPNRSVTLWWRGGLGSTKSVGLCCYLFIGTRAICRRPDADVRGEIGVAILSRQTGGVLVHRELTAADADGAIELLAGPLNNCGDLRGAQLSTATNEPVLDFQLGG